MHFLDELAVAQRQDPVAEGGGEVIMGDQKNRVVEFPLWRSSSSRRMSSPVAESRLPVGSSPSRIGRTEDEGAGDGHALALAAGKLIGAMVRPDLESHALQHRGGRSSVSCLRTPCKRSGRATFSSAVSVGSRLKVWKIMPNFSAPQAGAPVVIQRGKLNALQLNRAGSGLVQAANQVEKRRLPGAGRPHHRHSLALFDGQAQVVQGLNGPAVSVAFGDVGQLDHSRSREHPEMTGQCLKRELILPQGSGTTKM